MIRIFEFDALKPEEILNRDIVRKPAWKQPWMPLSPMCAPAVMPP